MMKTFWYLVVGSIKLIWYCKKIKIKDKKKYRWKIKKSCNVFIFFRSVLKKNLTIHTVFFLILVLISVSYCVCVCEISYLVSFQYMHKMKDYANDVKLILNPVKLFPSSLPCFNFIIFFLFFILYSLIISCLFSSWVIPDIRTLKAISFESWTISFYSYFGVKIFEEEIDPFKMYTPLYTSFKQ